MADDKKNIPDVASPTEAPAPFQPSAPEVPKAEKEQVQSPTPDKDDPAPDIPAR